MKRTISLTVLVVLGLCIAGRLLLRKGPAKAPLPPRPSASSAPGNAASAATYQNRIGEAERVAWLERLGKLPDRASVRDMYLAQRTSWWGKRLDPKQFWKGRVVWCDASARGEANAYGRMWPPIPYDDPLFRSIPAEDYKSTGAGSENYGATSVTSSREDAFWDYFDRTHPMPPDRIEDNQRRIAEAAYGGLPGTGRESALRYGCPPEALTDEVLRWVYILKKREQYEAALAEPEAQRSFRTNLVFQRLGVDRSYITDPLTDEQLKAANAWKSVYLQRLRREKTDESYINAYLKAWNLTSSDVFGD